MDDNYDRNGQREFQFSNSPDFNQLLAGRLSTGPKPVEVKPTTGLDPYKIMVNKKLADAGHPIDTLNIVKWPEKESQALEDFCKKMGIVGFNCGKMSPASALAMLKNMLGIVDGPLESRVPAGYESLGSKNLFNSNYPYQSAIQKKTLLNG